MPSLNVNTDHLVKYANKLEKLSRSAFPVVVRSTLNSAAFDVKKNTMPEAVRVFEKRDPNFFKANSKVIPAQGFDVKTMGSKVGFVSNKLQGKSNFAVKDLEQQEKGGSIKGKSFIPMGGARKGKRGRVKPRNRMERIKNIIDARKIPGRSDGHKFNIAANAAGKGGHVLSNYKGKTYLTRINSLNKTKSGQWKLTYIYSYEEGRAIKVKATNFMKIASTASSKKMNGFFIKAAKKQFEKALLR